LSFQLGGKRSADATVLRLAHAYEQATPWRDRRPSL
jgi:Asp-tRNA(Asn)/Glu-tRNA(Gln) amidotransferase A subunit family amidase